MSSSENTHLATFTSTWRFALGVLRVRSSTAVAAILTTAAAAVVLVFIIERVMDVIWPSLLEALGVTWGREVYRLLLLAGACCVCVLAGFWAALLASPAGVRAGAAWRTHLSGRFFGLWPLMLAFPILLGLPLRITMSTHPAICCASLRGAVLAFTGLLCWALIQTLLAAMALIRLQPSAYQQQKVAAFEQVRALFFIYVPMFVVSMAIQAAVDSQILSNDTNWELVWDVGIISDGWTSLLAALLAIGYRRQLDHEAGAAIFE